MAIHRRQIQGPWGAAAAASRLAVAAGAADAAASAPPPSPNTLPRLKNLLINKTRSPSETSARQLTELDLNESLMPDPPPTYTFQSVTPSQANNHGHCDALQSVTMPESVTLPKPSQLNSHGTCDGVTV
jgi:hypothetical protein